MAKYLKEGMSVDELQSKDAKVRGIVEDILGQIESKDDSAIREYSQKFDSWAPESFRLSKEQIDACYEELDQQVIDDFGFTPFLDDVLSISERALDAMDLDNDKSVQLDEALKVLFVGQIVQFLEDYPSTWDHNGDNSLINIIVFPGPVVVRKTPWVAMEHARFGLGTISALCHVRGLFLRWNNDARVHTWSPTLVGVPAAPR